MGQILQPGVGEEMFRERLMPKGMRELSGVMEIFSVLIVVMVIWVYIVIKLTEL